MSNGRTDENFVLPISALSRIVAELDSSIVQFEGSCIFDSQVEGELTLWMSRTGRHCLALEACW
jgi:hypothetical protein